MTNDEYATHIYDVLSHGQDVHLEHHVPVIDNNPYHTHPSIEINYLRKCEMTYSFSGEEIVIPRNKLCVFWAAYPHRPVALSGKGLITNAYVALQQFLDWNLSTDLVNQVLSGAMVCAKTESTYDRALIANWSDETQQDTPAWRKLHRQEIQARLSRLDVEGWEVISPPRSEKPRAVIGGNAVMHFDTMLRFIAQNAFESISVQDVADSAGISRNYAIVLFRKMLGVTVKAYILDLRIHHAKMMLADTNEKILTVAYDCGFASLSSFYEAFGNATGMTPAAFREGRD